MPATRARRLPLNGPSSASPRSWDQRLFVSRSRRVETPFCVPAASKVSVFALHDGIERLSGRAVGIVGDDKRRPAEMVVDDAVIGHDSQRIGAKLVVVFDAKHLVLIAFAPCLGDFHALR